MIHCNFQGVKKTPILLIEDNKEQVNAFKRNTPHYIELKTAGTYEEYEEIVKRCKFKGFITDLFIPFTRSSDEVNVTKNKELWREITSLIIEKYLIGEEDMMGFRNWSKGDNGLHKDPGDLSTWSRMHAHKMLKLIKDYGFEEAYRSICSRNTGEYEEMKRIGRANKYDLIMKNEGPWGFRIFMDQYFSNKNPVIMQTCSGAHGMAGSPVMMLMQNMGAKDFSGELPFFSLDGEDPRLIPYEGHRGKPYSDEIIKFMFESCHLMSGISSIDIGVVATVITFLDRLNRKNMEDIFPAEIIEKGISLNGLKDIFWEKNKNSGFGKEDLDKAFFSSYISRGGKIKEQNPFLEKMLRRGFEVLEEVFPTK